MKEINKLNQVMGNHEEVMFETLVDQNAKGLDFVGNEGGEGAVAAKVNSVIVDSQVGLQAPVVKVEETVTPGPSQDGEPTV